MCESSIGCVIMDALVLVAGVVTEWIHGGEYFFATMCSVVVALLSYVLIFVRFGTHVKLPPGPRGLPVVGNLLQMGARPHRAMTAMHEKYGHVVYLRLGCVPTVVVDSPALIAEVTKEQDNVFSSRPHMTFTDIVAYDAHDFAMAPYGSHWRHVRRICVNELLTPKRLASTARERAEESARMIAAVADTARRGELVDMRDAFAGVSMTVMCRMLLGRREFAAAGQQPKDFKHLIHELFRLMGALNLRDFVPALGWLDLQGFERDMHKVSDVSSLLS
jgi:cytochrome P450